MLLRRLYSSLPAGHARPAASLSSGPSTPRTPTRGRSKPARLSAGSSTGAVEARGSSRRRKSTSATRPNGVGENTTTIHTSSQAHASANVPSGETHSHPMAHEYSFRPTQIYPQQMWLHQSFLPRHMPIPANLGTGMYTAPASSSATDMPESELGPFARPGAPSALDMLRLSAANASSSGDKRSTALREHLRVTAALSRPDLVKHLGEPAKALTPAYGAYDSSDGLSAETDLVRTLAEAGVRNRLSGEWQWEQTLARLGGDALLAPSAPTAQSSVSASTLKQASQSQSADVDSAVDDLSALLNKLTAPKRGRRKPRLAASALMRSASAAVDSAWARGNELRAALLGEEDAEDIVVRMDSVKRKRKKKISKHKYKKRRKATRAQRRKMGK